MPIKMKDQIDYSLIWKYFNSSLSKEENEELKEWIQADKSHQEYFQKLEKQIKSGDTGIEQLDSYKALKNIKLAPKHKKSYKWPLSIAASILIIVAAYMGYELFKPRAQELIITENIQFEPGVKKATLVLDSGEKLELESKKDTLIKEAETLIENSDDQLNYTSVSKKKKVLKPKKEQKFNTLIVPRGGEYNLVLSDGTEIKLNSESILKYPIHFNKKERFVHLSGEAFFEVKTDSLRPFIIKSGDHIVKVYGTSFNIKSYDNEKVIATTLVEGKVTISDNRKNAKEHLLQPGFQSIYDKNTSEFKQIKVDIKQYTSWKDGRFYFRNMRLDEMTEILGRWYDVEFEFKNENLKALRFNGNLKRYDNIQNILNQLRKTNEITFTAYEKIIYVN